MVGVADDGRPPVIPAASSGGAAREPLVGGAGFGGTGSKPAEGSSCLLHANHRPRLSAFAFASAPPYAAVRAWAGAAVALAYPPTSRRRPRSTPFGRRTNAALCTRRSRAKRALVRRTCLPPASARVAARACAAKHWRDERFGVSTPIKRTRRTFPGREWCAVVLLEPGRSCRRTIRASPATTRRTVALTENDRLAFALSIVGDRTKSNTNATNTIRLTMTNAKPLPTSGNLNPFFLLVARPKPPQVRRTSQARRTSSSVVRSFPIARRRT
jgi:hypothetical protein